MEWVSAALVAVFAVVFVLVAIGLKNVQSNNPRSGFMPGNRAVALGLFAIVVVGIVVALNR